MARTTPIYKEAGMAPDRITSSVRQEPSEEINADIIGSELGVAGARISSGFVHEEFIPKLVGERGRRIFREMRDNDATVSAILFAIEMMLRAVEWRVEFDEGDSEAAEEGTSYTADRSNSFSSRSIDSPEAAVAFLEGVLFDDMEHTWEDFIAEVLSMLVFGWQYTEIVWKRRMGENEDFRASSIFDDGLIGIRKLADRSQETLDRWDIDEYGDIFGLWQEPPNGGGVRYIPMAKALLFRPRPSKGSPEGRSVLRNAYRSWFFLKNIQEIEAIAIERELNGLPVVYVPASIIESKTAEAAAALQKYVKLVRDVKYNEQGGIVLPSDPWRDSEGNPTQYKQVEFSLVNAGGTRAIDTNKVIMRYQGDIARTVLADFIMLGQGDKGSFALSANKTDLFLRAAEGWLEQIASTINRHLIPKVWAINGLDNSLMPYVAPGKIAPEDLEELGNYIQKLSAAGIMFTDEETVSHLRGLAGLPENPVMTEDAIGELEFEEAPEGGEIPTEGAA